jgi:hypothetical protein
MALHRFSVGTALVLSLAFSGPVGSQAAVWTVYGHVTSLMQLHNGNLHLWMDIPRVDISGCGGDRYVMASDNPTMKQNYAGLLAAFHTKQPARMYVVPGCTDGNPTVLLIQYGG